MRTALCAAWPALVLCGALTAQQTPQAPATLSGQAVAAKTAEDKAADARSAAAGAPVDPKAYLIGPEDVLSVHVWREPENSCQACVVRPDGKISLPLLGEIQAAGITPERLSLTIAEGLQKVMVHPEV